MTPMDEADVRAMVHLLGDIAIMDASVNEKRSAVMNGLAALVNADAWAWGVASNTTPGEHPAWSIFLHSGFGEDKFGPLLEALEHPEMAALQKPFLEEFARSGPQLTRLRQQFVPDAVFRKSEAAKAWDRVGFGPVIVCARNTLGGEVSSLGIYRRSGADLFTERESRIAHIILSEVAWLHENTFPNHPSEGVSALSPRLRQVLNCLLAGKSRKEIAADLGLSVHTLGDYIKSVYQCFGVRSHPELIRRFYVGDGGDTPR